MTTAGSSGLATKIAVASLVVGPLMMSVGDLMHPQESEDIAEQVAIIAAQPGNWYGAHLLLFIGALLFIPGVLAIARLVGERNPTAGLAGLLLLLVGFGALSAVFAFEMLIGRFIAQGADAAAAAALLEAFRSPWLLGVLLVPILCFFAGVATVAANLFRAGGALRWASLTFGVAALFLLVQIFTSQVILSQIGNVGILLAGAGFAIHLWRSERTA